MDLHLEGLTYCSCRFVSYHPKRREAQPDLESAEYKDISYVIKKYAVH